MGGWMDGWMDGWTDGRTDRYVEGKKYSYRLSNSHRTHTRTRARAYTQHTRAYAHTRARTHIKQIYNINNLWSGHIRIFFYHKLSPSVAHNVLMYRCNAIDARPGVKQINGTAASDNVVIA